MTTIKIKCIPRNKTMTQRDKTNKIDMEKLSTNKKAFQKKLNQEPLDYKNVSTITIKTANDIDPLNRTKKH